MTAKVGPVLTPRSTVVVGGVALGTAAIVGGVALSAPAMAATSSARVVVLKVGSSGSLVKIAQQRLGVTADGDFGPRTLMAVKTFQGRHGLATDGIVGPLTWARLGGFPSTGTAPAPTCTVKVVRYGASGSLVAALQSRLGVTADGDFGPHTLSSVQSFQSRYGITADGRGVVGRATWGALGGMPCGLSLTPPGTTAPVSGGSGGGSSTTTTAKLSQVISIAKQYLGVPYVYGGSTPAGFDCSGLTQYAYSHAGLTLPRTAAAQQAYMRSTSSPLPGDLVFFGSPAYHVGIYLGNGQMIAAPYPGAVVRIQTYINVSNFGTLR
ncbi:NlpC/P60 family protein [Allobranchiibius huperziae]|uniref:Cell wall-associated NlpC family hydrolase n=1 Tax=Allobranchiibius huperziae TaxID=1874116 RepID=A0A853DNU2_9MICO|nr:NlpC/P60 family protein [Allobranchiibius huperziae]NYJ76270.1 cell wall-associated NlpC family hydrolase [Allobranchiibius huperziae]